MVISGYWEERVTTVGVWKCASTMSGGLSVMTDGTLFLLRLPAGSWDSTMNVCFIYYYNIVLLHQRKNFKLISCTL